MRAGWVAALLIGVAGIPWTEQPITLYGIGPVRIGASVATASRTAGEPLARVRDECTPCDAPESLAEILRRAATESDACYHASFESAPTLLFMVEEGRIVRVETADERFATASGVHVGDSETRVRRIYGHRLEVTEHHYDENGHYFIVRSTDRRYALVMETDWKSVVYMRAGLVPAAEYVEGCL